MAEAELHYLQLTELTRKMHAGQLSPVEVTEAMLGRIAALDGDLHSYACVTADSAMDEAHRAEREIRRGEIKGPLHGAPVAVKDLFWTKGVKTTAGMALHADHRPAEDATVVRRLRNAGAIILGKLQMTEGAYIDHRVGIAPPVNPWSADFSPGGSSSGCGVATAAGLCYASLGSDTGGSIRFPSALQGLTGVKPTWGRASRHGVFALAPTLDHVGPMARSAADAAAMLAAIAGADPADPTALQDQAPDYMAQLDGDVRDVRIGLDQGWIDSVADTATQMVVADAVSIFRRLGARIVPIRFPDVGAIIQDWAALCQIEAAVAHEPTFPTRRGDYGAALAAMIDAGRARSAMDYQKIVLRRKDFCGRVSALFGTVDMVLTPALGFTALPLGQVARALEQTRMVESLLDFNCPFNMTGDPAIVMPGGFIGDNLPVAFQLVGARLTEAALLRAANAFQRVTDFHLRHPVGDPPGSPSGSGERAAVEA